MPLEGTGYRVATGPVPQPLPRVRHEPAQARRVSCSADERQACGEMERAHSMPHDRRSSVEEQDPFRRALWTPAGAREDRPDDAARGLDADLRQRQLPSRWRGHHPHGNRGRAQGRSGDRRSGLSSRRFLQLPGRHEGARSPRRLRRLCGEAPPGREARGCFHGGEPQLDPPALAEAAMVRLRRRMRRERGADLDIRGLLLLRRASRARRRALA